MPTPTILSVETGLNAVGHRLRVRFLLAEHTVEVEVRRPDRSWSGEGALSPERHAAVLALAEAVTPALQALIYEDQWEHYSTYLEVVRTDGVIRLKNSGGALTIPPLDELVRIAREVQEELAD